MPPLLAIPKARPPVATLILALLACSAQAQVQVQETGLSAISAGSMFLDENGALDETVFLRVTFYNSGVGFTNGIREYVRPKRTPTNGARFKYNIKLPDDLRLGPGGLLPGLQGGTKACTGSDVGRTCWSVQLAWRPDGQGQVVAALSKGAQKSAAVKAALQSSPFSAGGGEYLAVGPSFDFKPFLFNRVIVTVGVNKGGLAEGFINVTVNDVPLVRLSNVVFSTSTRPINSVALQAEYVGNAVPDSGDQGPQAMLVRTMTFEPDVENTAPPAKPARPPPKKKPPPKRPPPKRPPPKARFPSPPILPPWTPSAWEDPTADQRRRAFMLSSVFENGDVALQYGYCENLDDGRGLTWGYVGFTTATDDSLAVVQDYAVRKPVGNALAPYLPALANLARRGSANVSSLVGFCEAVAAVANEPEFRFAQDDVVNALYWEPAMEFARGAGLQLGLSKGQVYDAWINHGEGWQDKFSVNWILAGAEKAVGGTPATGVDEVEWLRAFIAVRTKMLLENGGANAARRMKFYGALVELGNLNFDGPIYLDKTPQADGWTISDTYYGKFVIP